MTRPAESPSGPRFFLLGATPLVAGVYNDTLNRTNPPTPTRDRFIVTRSNPGGGLGTLSVPNAQRTATGFRVSSADNTDTSTFDLAIIPFNWSTNPSGISVLRGTGTLVAGTATINLGKPFTSPVNIQVSRKAAGGALGFLSAPSASRNAAAGTFVVNSSNAGDTSTFDWMVIENNPRAVPHIPPSGTRIIAGTATLVNGTGSATIALPSFLSASNLVVLHTPRDLIGTGGATPQHSCPTRTASALTFASNDAADDSTIDFVAFAA